MVYVVLRRIALSDRAGKGLNEVKDKREEEARGGTNERSAIMTSAARCNRGEFFVRIGRNSLKSPDSKQ
jgi:hypothetical protein